MLKKNIKILKKQDKFFILWIAIELISLVLISPFNLYYKIVQLNLISKKVHMLFIEKKKQDQLFKFS